jgi:uncharacterized protein YndB with AHSA1/START domain
MGDMPDSASVSETIAAPPEVVWDLVADVTRMGEWSPETVRCRWLDGATGPDVGARFAGTNQYDRKRWRTECRVTEAERGRVFEFEVTGAKVFAVSRWRYELRPVDGGCAVTESWLDRRNPLIRAYGRLQLGIVDRAEHNRSTMTETLRRLKEAAEARADAADR